MLFVKHTLKPKIPYKNKLKTKYALTQMTEFDLVRLTRNLCFNFKLNKKPENKPKPKLKTSQKCKKKKTKNKNMKSFVKNGSKHKKLKNMKNK
jgi:hypothetical protein